MTKSTRNVILIVQSAVILLVSGTLFVFYYVVISFGRAFAPPEITVTHTAIRTSDEFINAITIERLKVDSFNREHLPVKYVVEYVTTCFIKQAENQPPVGLEKIRFAKPGRYSWTEEYVNIPILHVTTYRQSNDSLDRITWSNGAKRFPTCPLKFEKGNWYFIWFSEPKIVGIYVYIDSNGKVQQHTVYSGISPI